MTLDPSALGLLLAGSGALGGLVAFALRAGAREGMLRTRVSALEQREREHQSEYYQLRAAHQALAERVARSSGRAQGAADATGRNQRHDDRD